MKKVKVVKSHEVEVQAFILTDFIQYKAHNGTMKKMRKNELINLAERLGLVYDDAQIVFAKKLLSAYLAGK